MKKDHFPTGLSVWHNAFNSWLTMSGSLVVVSSIPGWVACENWIHCSSGINRQVTQGAKLAGEHWLVWVVSLKSGKQNKFVYEILDKKGKPQAVSLDILNVFGRIWHASLPYKAQGLLVFLPGYLN